MANDTASGFCKNCDKQVMITRKGTSHILHVFLSLITAGLWIPIWILCAIKIGGWRCSQCGMKCNRSFFR